MTPHRPRTLVIAEAGINHNGSMDMAKQLIDLAVEAQADIVKFQTFQAKNLVTRTAEMASYQKTNTGTNGTQFEMLKQVELNHEMHLELIKHCQNRNIRFLSTAFDLESIELLCGLGMSLFKIPSGEITNFPYLQRLGSIGAEIILSTGMANLGEIEAALEVLENAGTPRSRITVLHCTTEYPAPFEDVNLLAMRTVGEALRVKVGYSDHTAGISMPIAAVALGATVIEKHFTLSKDLPGPDHKASLEPQELIAMVKGIREVEAALGDGVKRASQSEQKNIAIARKSLVAARPIRAGELFSQDNLTTKRPGTGVSPMRWNDIIGKPASRNFSEDELISL